MLFLVDGCNAVFVGGFGVDFSLDDGIICDGLAKVASGILQHGVTSFCPTVVTSKPEVYKKVCKLYDANDAQKNFYLLKMNWGR